MQGIIAFLFFVQKGTPFEEVVAPTGHPLIIVYKDLEDASDDRFYIMIESEILHDTSDFTQALFFIVSCTLCV